MKAFAGMLFNITKTSSWHSILNILIWQTFLSPRDFFLPGIADILIFKEQATNILKVEEEYEDLHTRYIPKCIVDEIKGIANSKEEYHSRINSETAKSDVSTT